MYVINSLLISFYRNFIHVQGIVKIMLKYRNLWAFARLCFRISSKDTGGTKTLTIGRLHFRYLFEQIH